jgi:hypothetical protein
MHNKENADQTGQWLDRVEAAVERAHSALLTPDRGHLPQFTKEMVAASRERLHLTAAPGMAPRLAGLKNRLTLLQSMLRQAAAFLEAREQLETERVLGYTPKGLERAL